MPFKDAEKRTLDIEGSYSDHPLDPGGKTMYGITESEARAFGYQGPMQSMPLATAHVIYKTRYWDALLLDEVDKISVPIAHELFDTGVNAGVSTAGKFLQIALNALNRQQKDYPDLTTDGRVGPLTLHTMKQYMELRKGKAERNLLKLLNCMQGAYYLNLTQQNPKFEEFMNGWLERVEI